MANFDAKSDTLGAPDAGADTARVLIVEDDWMNAMCVSDFLEGAGYTVVGVASSGAMALSLAERVEADLAMIDITLSGPMDGIEVARRIREQHGIRAIFLSGTADPAVVARAEAAARPYAFLCKPFRPSQVFGAISRALADRRCGVV